MREIQAVVERLWPADRQQSQHERTFSSKLILDCDPYTQNLGRRSEHWKASPTVQSTDWVLSNKLIQVVGRCRMTSLHRWHCCNHLAGRVEDRRKTYSSKISVCVIGWAAVRLDIATWVNPAVIFGESRAYKKPCLTAVDAHSACREVRDRHLLVRESEPMAGTGSIGGTV